MRGRPPAVRALVLRSTVLLCAGLLAGCSVGEPPPYDETGVDGLVVPTPSPDPADFVTGIDNPWLPLVPGSTWRYEVRVDGEVEETIEVTVTEEVRRVAGVDATVVRDVVRTSDGKLLEETHDWFAQDGDGNVWLLGERGSWEAGVDGAMAGLAMPAEPRVGDGFQREWLPGRAEDRGEVLDVAASRTTAMGSWDDLVLIEDTTPLEPGAVEHELYARGTGLVLEESPAGDEVAELVAFAPGDA